MVERSISSRSPHRITCFQITSENSETISSVLCSWREIQVPEVPCNDTPTREDFAEYLMHFGTREDIVRCMDLCYFIPSCGVLQWAVVQSIMYYSPNFAELHSEYVKHYEQSKPQEHEFWHGYVSVFHTTNLECALEIIESGRIEAGPFGTEHHSGFFCCTQMALASLFSYLPFHNHPRHSRKRFLFGLSLIHI